MKFASENNVVSISLAVLSGFPVQAMSTGKPEVSRFRNNRLECQEDP
jgi:hypothetical protein